MPDQSNKLGTQLSDALTNVLEANKARNAPYSEREKQYGVIREQDPTRPDYNAWADTLGLPKTSDKMSEALLKVLGLGLGAVVGGGGGGKMTGPGGFPEGAPIYSLKPNQFEQLSAKIVGLPEAGKIDALKAAGYDVAKDYADYHPNKAFSEAANKAILQKELPLTAHPEVAPESKSSLANSFTEKLKEFEKQNEADYTKYSKQYRNEALNPEKAGNMESLKNRTSLDSLMGAKGSQENFTQQDLIDTSKQYRMLKDLFKDSPGLLQELDMVTPDQVKNLGTIIRKPNGQ